MPLYSYKHTCGFEQRFFLHEDKSSKVIDCYRCGRKVTANRVNDSSLHYGEKDGITGVLQRERQQPKSNDPR